MSIIIIIISLLIGTMVEPAGVVGDAVDAVAVQAGVLLAVVDVLVARRALQVRANNSNLTFKMTHNDLN